MTILARPLNTVSALSVLHVVDNVALDILECCCLTVLASDSQLKVLLAVSRSVVEDLGLSNYRSLCDDSRRVLGGSRSVLLFRVASY